MRFLGFCATAGSCSAWCPPGPRGPSPHVGPQQVWVPAAVPHREWDVLFLHAKPHESSTLRPPQFPLDGSTTIWCINHSSLCIACKSTICTPPAHRLPPGGLCATEPSGPSRSDGFQPISPLVYPTVFCQLAYENVTESKAKVNQCQGKPPPPLPIHSSPCRRRSGWGGTISPPYFHLRLITAEHKDTVF